MYHANAFFRGIDKNIAENASIANIFKQIMYFTYISYHFD